MAKRIIIQGRPLTIPQSGNHTFSINFIRKLAEKLSDMEIEVLVPKEIDDVFGSNVTTTVLPSISTDPYYCSTMIWENQQVFEYVSRQEKGCSLFLVTHQSLPIVKLHVPEVAIIHDIHLWIKPENNWPPDRKLAYEINKHALGNADKLCTVSEFTKNELIQHISKISNTPIVPIFEDVDDYYKTPQGKKADLSKFKVTPFEYFLYVGSMEPRKNLVQLLKAYEEYLLLSSSKKKLLVVGTNTMRSKEIGGVSIPSSVSRFENVTLEELYELYSHAYALVLPNLYEGFGLPILEAQHCACPVLASDIEVFHEVGNESLLFFSPTNASDVAHKLLELEKNTDLRKDLIERGERNCNRFSWDATINIFLSEMAPYL